MAETILLRTTDVNGKDAYIEARGTNTGDAYVAEKYPNYLQGVEFVMETNKSFTAGAAAAASTHKLPMGAYREFTPSIKVLAASAAETTVTVQFRQLLDGGAANWTAPICDASGNVLTYTLKCSSTTVPTVATFPPTEVTGGEIEALISCAAINATVSIRAMARP